MNPLGTFQNVAKSGGRVAVPAEVRAAHGLVDEAEQRAAGARFAGDLAREPALRKRFDALVAAAKAKGR